jgi:vancomycin aglycone glucosyltransferase
MVSAGLQFAGKSVAEHHGKPHWHAHHVPWLFESSHHPPMSVPFPDLPRFVNRLIWKVSIAGFTVMLRPVVNRHRRALGLGPVGNIQNFLSDGMLCAMDEELARVPPDVKVRYVQTGYWPLQDDREIDRDTARFIDAGDPPVYIGFGSMGESSPERKMRIIEAAVKEAGVRALVAGGWAQLTQQSGDGRIRIVGHLPHAKLFPRMAAVAHHGGAGTTYTAARAGVPQVVIPHILDQYFWGQRVFRLGIGPKALPRGRLSAQSLAEAIHAAASNAGIRQRARDISVKLAARDGLEEGVRIVAG